MENKNKEELLLKIGDLEKYSEYLATQLDGVIAYSEYLAGKLDILYAHLIKEGYKLPIDDSTLDKINNIKN